VEWDDAGVMLRSSGSRLVSIRLVLSAASVVLVASGCGDRVDTGSSSADAEAKSGPAALVGVDDSRLQPPGTPLGSGVKVQDGSRLVGRVFPAVDSFGSGSSVGWQALLVVDGDPVEVWNRYAEVLRVKDGDAPESCVVRTVTVPGDPSTTSTTAVVTVGDGTPSRFLTEPRLDGENRLDCDFTDGPLAMSMAVGAAVQCDSLTPASGCRLRPESHLFIRSSPGTTTSSTDLPRRGTDQLRYERGLASVAGTDKVNVPPTAAIPTGAVVAANLPTNLDPTRLPGPGDPIDDGIDQYLVGSPFKVPAGGRSLVAPSQLIDCNSGLVAVVSVPGKPEATVAWFDSSSTGDDPIQTKTGTDSGGTPWVNGLISTAGGYYLDITAVPAGDRTDALVTECGD